MPSPSTVAKPSRSRSAVTNGGRVLAGVDGNSAQARRYRDLLANLTAEAGPGLTEGDRLTIRNAATLQLHVEELTARLVRGEPVDAEALTRAANGATRALATLKRGRAVPRGRGRRQVSAHPFAREAAE